jgi:hypothetical protein
MFEGLGDQSFRTASSAIAPSPFIRLDPFHAENPRSVTNEVIVDNKPDEEDEGGWSDVSV